MKTTTYTYQPKQTQGGKPSVSGMLYLSCQKSLTMILQTRFEMSRVFLFSAYTILKIGTLFDILDYFGLYIYNSRNVNYRVVQERFIQRHLECRARWFESSLFDCQIVTNSQTVNNRAQNQIIFLSSSGRTLGFGPSDRGSNP